MMQTSLYFPLIPFLPPFIGLLKQTEIKSPLTDEANTSQWSPRTKHSESEIEFEDSRRCHLGREV